MIIIVKFIDFFVNFISSYVMFIDYLSILKEDSQWAVNNSQKIDFENFAEIELFTYRILLADLRFDFTVFFMNVCELV